ncbi:MAG: anti-sigma regulatory factor [Gammaproteobacteria bacterium]
MITETDLLRHLGGEAVDTLDETATIAIDAVADIVTARQRGREMALRLGFSETESTLIATIISELARNIVLYAQSGEIKLERATSGERRGLVITCRDNGPGIPDVQRAMVGGYSTSGGLGLGLCGVQRMVDELDIDTKVGKGTTITAKKWLY